MTMIFKEPNVLDRILGLLGKKRRFVLPQKDLREKFGPCATFMIQRESFFSALFRSTEDDLPEDVLDDIKEIEDQLKMK